MKYLGVDMDGVICAYYKKPRWNEINWDVVDDWADSYESIPASVFPPLEKGCLYKIEKDCYTLIEQK